MTLRIYTGDPGFKPDKPIIINGFRFVPDRDPPYVNEDRLAAADEQIAAYEVVLDKHLRGDRT